MEENLLVIQKKKLNRTKIGDSVRYTVDVVGNLEQDILQSVQFVHGNEASNVRCRTSVRGIITGLLPVACTQVPPFCDSHLAAFSYL